MQVNTAVPLVLASASPRRAELLRAAGFEFTIRSANVDESVFPNETPSVYVLRVATAKAQHVARDSRHPDEIVLAADTVVVAGARMMGKPVDDADAESMLRQLSGDVHEVLTAVVLSSDGKSVSEVVSTRVRFIPLSERQIRWYISTREPLGKAGAYAIQGRGARFIDWIDGSWSNVVGLPIATVYRLLEQLAMSD
jgi:septum formation protein